MTTPSSPLAPGAPAPEFTLPATTGGSIALSEYRGRGPVVLVFLRNHR